MPILTFTGIISICIFFGSFFLINNLYKSSARTLRTANYSSMNSLYYSFIGKLEQYDAAIKALAGSKDLQFDFTNPTDEELYHARNTATRYQTAIEADVIYLMDLSGTVLVTTNDTEPDSFLGKNYSFRNYFITASKGKNASEFLRGVTSGKRGYYTSAPIIADGSSISGVVVIKKEIDSLEYHFSLFDYAFFINSRGTIFLSSREELVLQSLWNPKIKPAEANQYLTDFGDLPSIYLLPENPPNDSLVTLNKDQYHVLRKPVSDEWEVIVLNSRKQLLFRYFLMVLIACFIQIILYITAIMISNIRISQASFTLLRQERRFRILFQDAPEAMLIMRKLNWELIDANNAALMLFGKERTEIIGNSFFAATGHSDIKLKSSMINYSSTRNLPSKLILDHEDERDISVSHSTINFNDQDCLLIFIQDTTEKNRSQKALEEREERLRNLANNLPEAIFELDASGMITFFNTSGYTTFGYDADTLIGSTHISALVCDSHKGRIRQYIAKYRGVKDIPWQEYEFIRQNGVIFPGIIVSSPVYNQNTFAGFIGLIIDISKRKKQEEDQRKIDKLESLGIMAGGFAHDFNNILTVIQSGVSFLELENYPSPDSKDMIGYINSAIENAKGITNQLLTFSKGGYPVKKTASVVKVIRDSVDFNLHGTNILVDYQFPEDFWYGKIDITQISEVIQNLTINAVQASKDGGRLNIRGTNYTAGENCPIPLEPGKYILITFSDNGPGISKEDLTMIFDPFFTTKEKGSGLGLAVANSIVTKHGGYMKVESEINQGTRFSIYLPATSEQPAKAPEKKQEIRTGNERILIVDDSEQILSTGKKLLERNGYIVDTATDSKTAIDKYFTHYGSESAFDLIILDLTLVGSERGDKVLEKIRKRDPDVKAIVSSGYAKSTILAEYAEYGFAGILEKPFHLDQMMKVIQKIL